MRWAAGLVGLLVVAWAVLYSIGIRSLKEGETVPPDAQLSPRVWKDQMRGWKKAQKILQNGGNIGKPKFPYKGPQTAESIMKAFDAKWRRMNPERATLQRYSPENVKALLERALERGAVVNDYDDYLTYAQTLLRSIKSYRTHDERVAKFPPPPPGVKGPPRLTVRELFKLPENASWEEVDDAVIDLKIRRWPTQKMWMDMAQESDEPIVRVNLDPESGALFTRISSVSGESLSNLEQYLITHHGVAPEGILLYYVDKDNRILPPEQVRLYSWDEKVAKKSDPAWEASMRYFEEWTPAIAEEEEWDTLKWMVFYDEYAAMMRSVETRGKSMPTPSSDSPVPGAAPGGTPAAPSEEPVGPPEPGVHEAPPPPPRRPFETREEQAVAYEMIMDAFIESNPQLDPETRELIKRQQEAYRRWLEMRPPSAQNMGQVE